MRVGEGQSRLDFSAQLRWMTQDEAIAEITRRLMDYFHPERVYPFGSAAVRWPASDFDMRARHVRASLPATIVREGKMLYDARTVAA